MKILCIINDDLCPSGVVGEITQANCTNYIEINPHTGAQVPSEVVGEFDGLIVMGGPMHAYDDDNYPALKTISNLMAKAHDVDIPILGMCLGAQLLARAFNQPRIVLDEVEVGFTPFAITDAGNRDALLSGLEVPPALQVHEDNFTLPPKAELLLTGTQCKNQAFRVGKSSYGFQCHLEVTAPVLHQWLDFVQNEWRDKIGPDPDGYVANISSQAIEALPNMHEFTRIVTGRWLMLVREQMRVG